MDPAALQAFLGRSESRYQLLLKEAATLLRNLDTFSPEEVSELIARRQEIVNDLQNVDHLLQTCYEQVQGSASRRQLDEFRLFQEAATGRILELDALVIALAKEQLDALKGDLAALAKRKTVLTAYEGNGHGMGW